MAAESLHPAFMHKRYLFRRKVFKLFGGAFHVYDEYGTPALYSAQKAFKLREDIRIYADERMDEELLTIKTPQIFDVAATYHIEDPTCGELIGSIKRRAFRSIFRDEWSFYSSDGVPLGRLTELSAVAALMSRLIKLIPQSYVVQSGAGENIAVIKQHFNPFVLKYSMTIPADEPPIDRRLILAAGILLAAIEKRQE